MAFIPVSSAVHKDAHFQPRTSFEFADQFPVTPVYHLELAELVSSYVLGFVKGESGFQLIAVIGTPELGTVYTYPDGKWSARYIPAALRGYPFNLLKAPETEDRFLCVEENALQESTEGLRLFTEAGELTEPVQKSFDLLQQVQAVSEKTDAAVNLLEQAGIIVPWNLVLNIDEQTQHKTSGLYRIDEAALNTMDQDQYASLQGLAMSIAYAQLYSIKNSRMLDLRLRAKKERKDQAFDFNEYLNESDSDSLKF